MVDGQTYELEPLLDDQELVMRGLTYWEGAVTLSQAGRRIGRGYLELTGYAGRVRL
jgi:predicted secreted hydrolase